MQNLHYIRFLNDISGESCKVKAKNKALQKVNETYPSFSDYIVSNGKSTSSSFSKVIVYRITATRGVVNHLDEVESM